MSENFLDFYFKNKMEEENSDSKAESIDSLESMTTSKPVKTVEKKPEFKQTRKINLVGLDLEESPVVQTSTPKPVAKQEVPKPEVKPVPKPETKPKLPPKPVQKEKPKGEVPLEGNELEKLFIQSETPTSLKEQWIS